jgi:hydroxyacylglutathione hydrolase
MSKLRFEGWHLIGAFPDNEPDDVGSWILSHKGEAALVEVPEGLTVKHVQKSLGRNKLRFAVASHEHEDHFDTDAWDALIAAFPDARFIRPSSVAKDMLLELGGEPLWLIKAPKHSTSDVVIAFRGVAMTGDIELGMLESVNDEVPSRIKRKSMEWLKDFERRSDYHVHSIVSAHLNDVRTSVNWPSLFEVP